MMPDNIEMELEAGALASWHSLAPLDLHEPDERQRIMLW
jgi:hypothetical protein